MSPELQLAALGFLIITFFLMTELGARISYRRNFGGPYRVKRQINYPANQFIENISPPLYYRFKPGFRSALVNINRFGLRGLEPANDGSKKRFLFIGESPVFGSKLENEDKIWARELEQLLDKNGHGDWEVINGGFPMYNSCQQAEFWSDALDTIQPSVLLINIGGNDIGLAWVLGEAWEPGKPWPESLIRPPVNKQSRADWILQHICLYHFFSMIIAKPAGWVSTVTEIDWNKCQDAIINSYRHLHKLASARGIPVYITGPVPVYSLDNLEAEAANLAGLQLDYRRHLETGGVSLMALYNALKDELAAELNVPFIDLYAAMQGNPGRLKCYHDLLHWNARGMNFIAKTLYQEGTRLHWWE